MKLKDPSFRKLTEYATHAHKQTREKKITKLLFRIFIVNCITLKALSGS